MVVEIGLTATEDEDREITRLFIEARNTPVIIVGGTDLSAAAYERMNKRIHEIVMSYGFPDIPGYYGYDGRTRAYTKWVDEPVSNSEGKPAGSPVR